MHQSTEEGPNKEKLRVKEPVNAVLHSLCANCAARGGAQRIGGGDGKLAMASSGNVQVSGKVQQLCV